MLLIEEEDILNAGIDWSETTAVIKEAVRCMADHDYAQPLKPYLRYRNSKNRIIAMPAFVGGNINSAGIKWIASFPDNISRGMARAHSVVILNNADTGEPVAIINTALLSVIRTASVSGLVIQHFRNVRPENNLRVGIIGFGPIGRYHLKMCRAILGNCIGKIAVYDIRFLNLTDADRGDNLELVTRWEDAYVDADIVITCTVADGPYINKKPKPGSLHLNVSLRDYTTAAYDWFKDTIIVDDWEEVCREKTDIERMHIEKGLRQEDTHSLVDVVQHSCLAGYEPKSPVLFNPMGMAVFDVAIGNYYASVVRQVASCR